MPTSGDPERHRALLQLKLRALVRDHTGDEPTDVGGSAGAAWCRQGATGWFLGDEDPERSLGPALAWARQAGVEQLEVVVDDPAAAGVLARRARSFRTPPGVWSVDDRRLVVADPVGHRPPVPPPDGIETLVALIEQAGIDLSVEHGEVTGEVLGLEVARIVVADDGPRLEVGVGRHDREAFALLHGDVPRVEALAAVVDAARTHRSATAEGHPLTRLVPERWLRALLLAEPGRVGAVSLEPIDPIRPRDSVKDVIPAAALGVDATGRPVLAVCSVGVDLDLVPEAGDLVGRELGDEPDAVVRLVLPAHDALPVVHALAAELRTPCEVVAVADDWRR